MCIRDRALVEAAAEHDESLMEKFFEQESLTEDEMREGIRKGLASRGMFLSLIHILLVIECGRHQTG